MLLDIGVGILLGLWLGPGDQTSSVLLGILFTLLPDIDVLIYFLIKRFGSKTFKDHREILHYPLPYLAIGGILVLIISPAWLPLFIAASMVQFIHDSVGIGWGIPWLYPFSRKYFKFFYQYDLKRAGQSQKTVWAWSKQEQHELLDKYGDPEWHKHTFHFIKYAPWWHLFEASVFLVALVLLYIR